MWWMTAVVMLTAAGSVLNIWGARRLDRARKALVDAAKELERREREFEQTQAAFVLGIHTAHQAREQRIKEAQSN